MILEGLALKCVISHLEANVLRFHPKGVALPRAMYEELTISEPPKGFGISIDDLSLLNDVRG